LIHDWGEAVTGDISYHIKTNSFNDMEDIGFKTLIGNLPRGKEYISGLWQEFEKGTSIAALIVELADAFESWLEGLITPSAWWPAWEDFNGKAETKLRSKNEEIANVFKRLSKISKDAKSIAKLSDSKNSCSLSDQSLLDILNFFYKIYCVKELPRHGFTIWGLKRSETDSFAEHMFLTASLSYLIAIEMGFSQTAVYRSLMMGILHDISTSTSGDVAYDLQVNIKDVWSEIEFSAIENITKNLDHRCKQEIKGFLSDYTNNASQSEFVWVVRVASGLDTWEIGVTTPSAWMISWQEHLEKRIELLKESPLSELRGILIDGSKLLSEYVELTRDGKVYGRSPVIKPIRMPK
jgi:5'-deoxynucleotidase YfbR-like HD superfamily hydrolase